MTLVNDTTQLNEQEKETKSSEQNLSIKLYNERNTKDFLYDIAWFNIISFAAWFCGLTPESESNSTHSTYLLTINVLLSIAALYAGLHKHSEMLKHKTRLYETNIYFNTAIIVKMLASRLNKLHYYIT